MTALYKLTGFERRAHFAQNHCFQYGAQIVAHQIYYQLLQLKLTFPPRVDHVQYLADGVLDGEAVDVQLL